MANGNATQPKPHPFSKVGAITVYCLMPLRRRRRRHTHTHTHNHVNGRSVGGERDGDTHVETDGRTDCMHASKVNLRARREVGVFLDQSGHWSVCLSVHLPATACHATPSLPPCDAATGSHVYNSFLLPPRNQMIHRTFVPRRYSSSGQFFSRRRRRRRRRRVEKRGEREREKGNAFSKFGR